MPMQFGPIKEPLTLLIDSTISFSNNDYSLPEGTELEDNVKEFLDRNWGNKINKFY